MLLTHSCNTSYLLRNLLRWRRARELFESQFPVTTGELQLQISNKQNSFLTYQTIRPM